MDTPHTSTTDPTENPWSRPGFLISACVIAVIAALGVYLGVTSVRDVHRAQGHVDTTSTQAPMPSALLSPAAASSCGLPNSPTSTATIDLHGTTWHYSNATGYPISAEYGPGRVSKLGYRYCYQHSAGGALFAAANSLAFDNSSKAEAQAWWEYMLADGRYRQARLEDDYVPNDPSVRLKVIGYKMMSYSPREAWIDIAVLTSSPDGTTTMSVVSDLVWQRGDWRFSTAELESSNIARIDDLTGYTSWGAD